MIDYKLALDFSEHKSLSIGILSDTHGKLHPEIAALIKQCDIALHAGDIMGGNCLREMQPKLGKTYAVKGNNDAPSTWEKADYDLLHDIPDQIELNLPGGTLVMEHSHRFWDKDIQVIHHSLRQEYPDVQLVVYGHTHIITVDDSTLPMLVNPGAAGEVRNHNGPSCIKLDVNADKWALQSYQF